jgi:hypothetical protein
VGENGEYPYSHTVTAVGDRSSLNSFLRAVRHPTFSMVCAWAVDLVDVVGLIPTGSGQIVTSLLP